MSAVEELENINPLVKSRASERVILPSEQDDSIHDEFDAREIFGKAQQDRGPARTWTRWISFSYCSGVAYILNLTDLVNIHT